MAVLVGSACGPTVEGEGSAGGDDTGVSTVDTGDDDTEADSADNTGANAPDVECVTTVESDLPGVSIDIEADCAYTLAQAQAGVETTYTITIDEALADIDSGNECDPTPDGGLHVDWFVRGGVAVHCQCDNGPCGGDDTPMPTTLEPGQTMGRFSWAAYAWTGPSDTNVGYGAAFLPGEHTIEVVATGTRLDANGTDWVPFSVRATRPVLLVE